MSNGTDDNPKARASVRVLWRLRGFLWRHRWRFALVAGLVLATVGMELAVPWAFGRGIDSIQALGTPGVGAAVWHDAILRWALILAALVFVGAAVRFVLGLAQVDYQQRMQTDLRCTIYHAVQRLSLKYHSTITTGELISRGTRDIDKLRQFFSGALFESVSLVCLITGVLVFMLRTRPSLALVTLWTVPIVGVLLVRFARRLRPMWKAASDRYGELTTVLQENIAGTRVVKAFGRERDEIHKFGGASARYLDKSIEANCYWAGRMPLANFAFGVTIPLLLVYGGVLVGQGAMRLGELTQYLGYLTMLSFRIRAVGRIVNIIQEATGSAERFMAVLDEEPAVADRPGAGPMPPGRGRVEFRHVSFEQAPRKTGTGAEIPSFSREPKASASASAPFALHDVAFTAEPGQMVAVVGRTGCGKSTLLSLIPRFDDPAAGAVVIDGADLRDVRLRDLRRSIGFIFQEPFLFSATVAETIAYGRPDASMEEIRTAALAAQAAQFIEELPEKYDTVIGERGVTLSGGQRQRLAIARAILVDPRILIMDDATSSVDAETEHSIHEALMEVAKGRTTFIVSQRLTAVRRADLILVFENGRIVERGTHEELLALNGTYRQLFATQVQ